MKHTDNRPWLFKEETYTIGVDCEEIVKPIVKAERHVIAETGDVPGLWLDSTGFIKAMRALKENNKPKG